MPLTLAIGGLFPNPANLVMNVIIETPLRDHLSLQVMDMNGRVMAERKVTIEAGDNIIPFDISRLAKGLYLLKMVCPANCESVAEKFVKQ